MSIATPGDINIVMNKYPEVFRDFDLRWRAIVWAAKGRSCSKCGAEPYQRCMNMADVKVQRAELGWGVGSRQVRATKWPHAERVDWDLLLTTLRARGYE